MTKRILGWAITLKGKPYLFETVSRKQFIQNWGPLQSNERVVRAEIRLIKRSFDGQGTAMSDHIGREAEIGQGDA